MGIELRKTIVRQEREIGKVRKRLKVLSSVERPEGIPAKLMIAV